MSFIVLTESKTGKKIAIRKDTVLTVSAYSVREEASSRVKEAHKLTQSAVCISVGESYRPYQEKRTVVTNTKVLFVREDFVEIMLEL